jgi:hypothetical protein
MRVFQVLPSDGFFLDKAARQMTAEHEPQSRLDLELNYAARSDANRNPSSVITASCARKRSIEIRHAVQATPRAVTVSHRENGKRLFNFAPF